MDIAGKVFIVTGGASGLGEGSVRMLASQYDGSVDRTPKDGGCRVCITLRAIEMDSHDVKVRKGQPRDRA